MHCLLCRNEVEAEHEVFVHTSAVALSRQVKKQRMQWPPEASSRAKFTAPMIDRDSIQELERPCRLDTGQATGLLREHFVSGQQMLCRNFTCFELPDEIKSNFEAHISDQPLQDLAQYDRLFVFTDGTSSPEVTAATFAGWRSRQT